MTNNETPNCFSSPILYGNVYCADCQWLEPCHLRSIGNLICMARRFNCERLKYQHVAAAVELGLLPHNLTFNVKGLEVAPDLLRQLKTFAEKYPQASELGVKLAETGFTPKIIAGFLQSDQNPFPEKHFAYHWTNDLITATLVLEKPITRRYHFIIYLLYFRLITLQENKCQIVK